MSCLVKIRSIKDTLSANELKIADFVLKITGFDPGVVVTEPGWRGWRQSE